MEKSYSLTRDEIAAAFKKWRDEFAAHPETFSDGGNDPTCHGDADYFLGLAGFGGETA